MVSSLVSGPGNTDIDNVIKLADSNLIFRAENIPYIHTYFEVNSDRSLLIDTEYQLSFNTYFVEHGGSTITLFVWE